MRRRLVQLAVLGAIAATLVAFVMPRAACIHFYGLPPQVPGGFYQPLAVGHGELRRVFCPPGHRR